MANVLVEESSLEAIADAIRSKRGVSDTYLPSEMADAIDDIGGGVNPTGTKQISITANGTTTEDVTNYASAEITANVPNSYTASDEGKVVSNGALVAQTSDTVTENDTYDTTLINSLTVNVSGGGGGASGSFTPDSNTRTISISFPSQPSGVFCYADYDGYPTDNTWKIFSFAYLDDTNGGYRITRYSTGNWNVSARAANTFVYSNGTLTVTMDYNFIAGVTYNWVAW